MSTQANVVLVESFWDALGRRDFAGVGAFMSERGHYVDVPVIAVDAGAYGPVETEARHGGVGKFARRPPRGTAAATNF